MLLLCFTLSNLWAQSTAKRNYPAPTVEIHAEHPAFLFTVTQQPSEASEVYLQRVMEAWASLPEDLRPYSMLRLLSTGTTPEARQTFCHTVAPVLQETNIPTVVQIQVGNAPAFFPTDKLRALLDTYTIIKGVEVTGLQFDRYRIRDGIDPLASTVEWLMETLEAAAQYGRFVHLALDGLHWSRLMANVSCAPLHTKMSQCSGYIIPSVVSRGDHYLTSLSSVLGLWLEGAATQWGVTADTRWYTDNHYMAPNQFGDDTTQTSIPSSLYRALLLNGAMTGAAVYTFPASQDLWFGNARHHWDQTIHPTITELLAKGLISRRDFVHKKAPVAYQLTPSVNPLDFHLNLRDIDAVLDAGYLVRGAYNVTQPGQTAELIPNNGQYFWIPLLSAYAPATTLETFQKVVQPGVMLSAQEWTELLTPLHPAYGAGDAFITAVGRGIFIMNSHENRTIPQQFSIPDAPAPVRSVTAQRTETEVVLEWPFREGDVSYSVYRRILPELNFTPVITGLEGRRYADTTLQPDQTVAYAVTALTNEKEPYEGVVQYGQYLTLSAVESRIAEEVLLTPMLAQVESTPIAQQTAMNAPVPPSASLTMLEGLEGENLSIARTLSERIEAWRNAIVTKDLNLLLDLYATDYEDPQGWRFQYMRRAYQWLFERYQSPHMAYQVRRWDFSTWASTQTVNMLLYCRITAHATTDASGHIADPSITLPRTQTAEVWVTWAQHDGLWRITSTNPALPNFRDLLSYLSGPYDTLTPGPDIYQAQ